MVVVDAPDETTTIYTAAGFAGLPESPPQVLPPHTDGTPGR
jgi:hypothetical protein